MTSSIRSLTVPLTIVLSLAACERTRNLAEHAVSNVTGGAPPDERLPDQVEGLSSKSFSSGRHTGGSSNAGRHDSFYSGRTYVGEGGLLRVRIVDCVSLKPDLDSCRKHWGEPDQWKEMRDFKEAPEPAKATLGGLQGVLTPEHRIEVERDGRLYQGWSTGLPTERVRAAVEALLARK